VQIGGVGVGGREEKGKGKGKSEKGEMRDEKVESRDEREAKAKCGRDCLNRVR